MADLKNLHKEITEKVNIASTLKELDDVRIYALGKKGIITEEFKKMGSLSDEEKKSFGKEINNLKEDITKVITEKKEELEDKEINAKLENERIDVTLPVYDNKQLGRLHPISRTIEELTEIFSAIGFRMAQGPEIEDDYHNFSALNLPPHHPARDTQDTFYLKSGNVLRTQTSNVQIREMTEKGAPIKLFSPGKVFRREMDATHAAQFHQLEALYVDKNVTMRDLIGCLQYFISTFFEKEVEIRLRPHYFPFTEPSGEIDVKCKKSKEKFIVGEGDDWIELLGCGMVHPNVLKNCNVDPKIYQGYAFGIGIERFAMLKYGMPDIRGFYASDIKWMEHFGFLPIETPSNAEGLS